jgi:hypothetical protein
VKPDPLPLRPKRYRIASMIRDLRDLFSLTMHIRKHGLEAKDSSHGARSSAGQPTPVPRSNADAAITHGSHRTSSTGHAARHAQDGGRCEELPAPTHRTAHRMEPTRDRAAQARFRNLLIQRSGGQCEYPGCTITTELQAHHDRAGYNAQCGRLLCREHHKAEDPHAR